MFFSKKNGHPNPGIFLVTGVCIYKSNENDSVTRIINSCSYQITLWYK